MSDMQELLDKARGEAVKLCPKCNAKVWECECNSVDHENGNTAADERGLSLDEKYNVENMPMPEYKPSIDVKDLPF